MCKTKECKKCGVEFNKTGQADKFCMSCRDVKTPLAKYCKLCDAELPRTQGPKKYCKACALDAIKLRAQRESIRSAIGKSCSVRFINCLECGNLYTARSNYKRKIDVCGLECQEKIYARTSKESSKWVQYPFQFKLSEQAVAVRSRLRRVVDKAQVGFCCFCGSAKVLGDAVQRSVGKGRRCFCDEDCACKWKSIHYASPNHKPMEELRQKTKARKQAERLLAEAKKAERLARRLARPANKKTPGYVTCIECNKTVWVEQHAQKKYCSEKCAQKAYMKTEKYKSIRRESKRNREHIKRSKGIGDKITIPELMKKHKKRCVKCQTICVKPEGYNWDNEANIDHILPIAAGGLHVWSNVQLLCRRCNMAKGAKVADGAQLMLDLRFERWEYQ